MSSLAFPHHVEDGEHVADRLAAESSVHRMSSPLKSMA